MIIDSILADIKTAMKNKDAAALTALRGIHAQIKDATVNAGKDLTDDAVLACLEKAVKQRADAIALYEKGGRPELAAKEQAEMDLFKRYLPALLSREEIEALARDTIASTGLSTKKDMGKLMTALKPQIAHRADGKTVSQILQGLLA